MVLMKKGEDTKYVADIFIPHYLGRGYEVIFPKKAVEATAQVVVEEKPKEARKPDDTVEAPSEPLPPVTAEPEPEKSDIAEVETKPEESVDETETPAPKKALKCPICGKEYTRNAYLVKHIEKEHPEN